MNQLLCQEVEKLTGISVRRLQQLCQENKIEGAIKEHGVWLIPESFVTQYQKEVTPQPLSPQKKSLPLGVTSYIEAVRDCYYVDKTLLIKDFIDDKNKAFLITRPRRFGKTLTMDMLRVYFEKTKQDTSIYFKDKAIWSCGEYYRSYQGQYPVIFLSFKDIKCITMEETLRKIKKLVSLEFNRHCELASSRKLTAKEQELYQLFVSGQEDDSDLESSLQILSLLLYKYYHKECLILIDEYDMPIDGGYHNGFYNDIIRFMRNFFSSGLKDNLYCSYGVMTGILRIAQESIFSGLNNVTVNSLLNQNYSQYFGFTVDEVKELLAYYNMSDKYNEVCEWYDGYLFGNRKIFNPWSVLNYVALQGEAQMFWVSTGYNAILGDIIAQATPDTLEKLNILLTRHSIISAINTDITYAERYQKPYVIFSFLLLTGYLTIKKRLGFVDGIPMYEIAIPNKELIYVYKKEILDKISSSNNTFDFQEALYAHNINYLQAILEQFLKNTISNFDGAQESFYHGLMLGLCALVSSRYEINSNKESGYGRFDIELVPFNHSDPAFIIELKATKEESDLENLALLALEQIETKAYDSYLKSQHITQIIKIGMSFSGKKVCIKTQ